MLHLQGKVFMPDVPGLILFEGGITQYVVEVNVGIDYVTDREGRYRIYGFSELGAYVNRAAGVDDGNAFIPDYETDIGDIVVVGMLQIYMFALVDVVTLADFGQIECFIVIRGSVSAAGQGERQ